MAQNILDVRSLSRMELISAINLAMVSSTGNSLDILTEPGDNLELMKDLLTAAGASGISEQSCQDAVMVNVKLPGKSDNSNKSKTVVITSKCLGSGSEELGIILMRNFLYTLTQFEKAPKEIILLNTGVYLATTDSHAIDSLRQLASKETQVLACGTCLDYYELKDRLEVGEVTNMYSIAEILLSSKEIVKV